MIGRVPIEELKPVCGRSRERMTATLRSWGLPALPDIDGWPIVLRADLERALSAQPAEPVVLGDESGIDWSEMRTNDHRHPIYEGKLPSHWAADNLAKLIPAESAIEQAAVPVPARFFALPHESGVYILMKAGTSGRASMSEPACASTGTKA